MERLNNSQKHFDLYGWHALNGQKLLAQDCYGPQATRPERAEALSPGQRPGYNVSLQCAL